MEDFGQSKNGRNIGEEIERAVTIANILNNLEEEKQNKKNALHKKYNALSNIMYNLNIQSKSTVHIINFCSRNFPPQITLSFFVRDKLSECNKFWRYEFFNYLKETFTDLHISIKNLMTDLEKKDRRDIHHISFDIGEKRLYIKCVFGDAVDDINIKDVVYGFDKCNDLFEHFMKNISNED